MDIVNQVISFFAYLFVFAVGILVLGVAELYVVDITQTKHAIRRNYPVIGRFRYYFEELGEFFRQYFSQWIARKCRSIGRRGHGYIGRRKASTIRSRSDPHEMSVASARHYS